MLKDTKISKHQFEYIHLIEKTSTALLAVLKDILDSSRLENLVVSVHQKIPVVDTLFPVISMATFSSQEKSI